MVIWLFQKKKSVTPCWGCQWKPNFEGKTWISRGSMQKSRTFPEIPGGGVMIKSTGNTKGQSRKKLISSTWGV